VTDLTLHRFFAVGLLRPKDTAEPLLFQRETEGVLARGIAGERDPYCYFTVWAMSSAHRSIADPVTWAGPQTGGAVAGVGELAAIEREAAAADALREPEL
jgi:hypothetical protein